MEGRGGLVFRLELHFRQRHCKHALGSWKSLDLLHNENFYLQQFTYLTYYLSLISKQPDLGDAMASKGPSHTHLVSQVRLQDSRTETTTCFSEQNLRHFLKQSILLLGGRLLHRWQPCAREPHWVGLENSPVKGLMPERRPISVTTP